MDTPTKDLPKWLDPNDPDRTFAQRAAAPMLFIGVAAVFGGGANWIARKTADRFVRTMVQPTSDDLEEDQD